MTESPEVFNFAGMDLQAIQDKVNGEFQALLTDLAGTEASILSTTCGV